MKNYAQVYVKSSFEAAEIYCKAFGAEITFEVKNDTKTACMGSVVDKYGIRWRVMTDSK